MIHYKDYQSYKKLPDYERFILINKQYPTIYLPIALKSFSRNASGLDESTLCVS